MMIKEMLTYFLSHSSSEAKAFGHLYESIALIQREKRCQPFWLPHRNHCKNFISTHLSIAKRNEAILILGSGPLHEIPLPLIASTFTRVDLVDIVQLQETKKTYSHLKNVRFIEADITELEAKILKDKKAIHHTPSLFLDQDYDLVISANLLSQLSYHIRGFLEKKARPKLSVEELDRYAHEISFNHLKYLQTFPCPVILITDIETHFYDKEACMIHTERPYIDFEFPLPRKEWIWNVAPIPEYSKEMALKMKIAAFIFNS